MIKRILCLALAIVSIAGTAVIGVSAADAYKIYEIPAYISKTAREAFRKNQDSSQYGPLFR